MIWYVEPEYWDEGYAEGDPRLASATVPASFVVTAAGVYKWTEQADTAETWTQVFSEN